VSHGDAVKVQREMVTQGGIIIATHETYPSVAG
jgi:hypothetical protein